MDLVRRVADLYSPMGRLCQMYVRFRLWLAGLDRIGAYLPRAGGVLDLGCGLGTTANYLALEEPGRSVVGLDSDRRSIDRALQTVGHRENIAFRVGDVRRMELPECQAVVVTDFLHHLSYQEQDELLDRVYGRLAQGGLILIQEVGTAPLWKQSLSYMVDLLVYREWPRYRSSPEWTQLLAEKGFRGVRVLPGDAGIPFARVSYLAYR